mmetsp:Transcript_10349/g.11804  ORF Transcript_10349/g.11804 Transcript_10349/m.11804 type:complete len:113 (+) Transcript_10349:157-495(+)
MLIYAVILFTDPWSEDKKETRRSLFNYIYEPTPVVRETEHRELAASEFAYTVETSETFVSHFYGDDATEYNPFYDGFNIAISFPIEIHDPSMFLFYWISEGSTDFSISELNY